MTVHHKFTMTSMLLNDLWFLVDKGVDKGLLTKQYHIFTRRNTRTNFRWRSCHVACKSLAVGSRSNGFYRCKKRFHEHCSSDSVHCSHTVHLVEVLCIWQPRKELLRVHDKCTQKIKVNHFSFQKIPK
jgi:hypothetical protein